MNFQRLFRQAERTIKFWWQRRTRGWDDSELWSLDHSLAQVILPRLKAFAASRMGYPADMTNEQWSEHLETMINSFEAIASEDYWGVEGLKQDEEIQRGLDLFGKYYRALWS